MYQKLPVIQVFLIKLTIKIFTIMMVEFKSLVPKTLSVKSQCPPPRTRCTECSSSPHALRDVHLHPVICVSDFAVFPGGVTGI